MESGISYKRRTGMMVIILLAACLLLAGFQSMVARASSTAKTAQVPAAASPLFADKVIVLNYTGTINIIDTATDIVYGPFLTGTLGSSGGGIFDVAVTPDGNKALISNFGDSAVYFVDIRNPLNPSVIISVTTPMFAEDIDITSDGKFALVTDGGFNSNIASISLISNTIVYTTVLESNRYSNAVAIAPNRTVVLADYFNGEVHSMLLDPNGTLAYTGSYSYTVGPDGSVTENIISNGLTVHQPTGIDNHEPASPAGPLWAGPTDRLTPVNIAIAPDGQTVLVCNASPYTSTTMTASFDVGVYRITAPGVLSFSGAVTGLNRATQSVAFSPDGKKAYLSGNGGDTTNLSYDQISVLNITGPGVVQLEQNGASDYARITGSQLFGVDTIVVVNGKAYLGFPTVAGATKDLRIVNLGDYSAKRLIMSGMPVGVAVIPSDKLYIPLINKPTP